jgi:hypothetical protein
MGKKRSMMNTDKYVTRSGSRPSFQKKSLVLPVLVELRSVQLSPGKAKKRFSLCGLREL